MKSKGWTFYPYRTFKIEGVSQVTTSRVCRRSCRFLWVEREEEVGVC